MRPADEPAADAQDHASGTPPSRLRAVDGRVRARSSSGYGNSVFCRGDRRRGQRAGERQQRAGRRLERVRHQLRRRVQRAVAGDVLSRASRASVAGSMFCSVLDRERPVEQVAAHRRAVADRHHPAARRARRSRKTFHCRDLAVLEVTVEARLADAVDTAGVRSRRRRAPARSALDRRTGSPARRRGSVPYGTAGARRPRSWRSRSRSGPRSSRCCSADR